MNKQNRIPNASRRLLLALWLTAGAMVVRGQEAKPNWVSYDYKENFKEQTIQHKPSFFTMKNGQPWTDAVTAAGLPAYMDGPAGQMQGAHEYVDTLYVRKGTKIRLTLPDRIPLGGNTESNARSYQRWYNYNTDGLFQTNRTGEEATKPFDLLTPSDRKGIEGSKDQPIPYRYANGYVGSPTTGYGRTSPGGIENVVEMMDFYYPTDAEFAAWGIQNKATLQGESVTLSAGSNECYRVAVDVSRYRDFKETYTAASNAELGLDGNGNVPTDGQPNAIAYEPTLNHRIIYYIYGVDEGDTEPSFYEQAMKSEAYQGGTLDAGKRYWGEYDMTYPYYRSSIHTFELVALMKDANAYALPLPAGVEDTDQLTVTLYQGEDTKIQLIDPDKAKGNSSQTNTNWQNWLAAGNTITISGTNRVIHFQYMYQPEGYRTLRAAGTHPGCQATLTVTKTVGGTTYNLARFNLTFQGGFGQLTHTQVKMLEEKSWVGLDKYEGKFWTAYYNRTNQGLRELYGDPKVTLGFENYDPGSMETWLKQPIAWKDCSFGYYSGNSVNSTIGIQHSSNVPQWGGYGIVGPDQKKNMNKFLPEVDWVSKELSTHHLFVDASDRPGIIARLPIEAELCMGGQIFVTAWVKSDNNDTRNCDGAMLFTILGVSGEGDQKSYTPIYRYQTGQFSNRYTNERKEDYPIDGSGGRTEKDEWSQVYFSFTNTNEKYNEYLLQISNNSASTQGGDMYLDDIRVYTSSPTVRGEALAPICGPDNRGFRLLFPWEPLIATNQAKGEISVCVIDKLKYEEAYAEANAAEGGGANEVTDPQAEAIERSWVSLGKDGANDLHIFTFTYNNTFEENEPYDATNSLATKDATQLFRYETAERFMAINIKGDFKPDRPYMILVAQGTATGAASFDHFDGDCSVRGEFRLESQNLVELNANLPEDGNFCSGQTYNFRVNMRTWDGQKFTEVHETVYHDWFFGSEQDFILKHSGSQYQQSLAEALRQLRAEYPTADNKAVRNDKITPKGDLTANMIQQIKDHIEMTMEETGHSKLTLYQTSMNVQLPSGGLEMVAIPVYDAFLNSRYPGLCWSYVPFSLTPEGDAPSLRLGFGDVTYPTYYNQYVRIGLRQLKACDSQSSLLRIPLRNARTIGTEAVSMTVNTADGLNHLYLIYSNDPAIQAKLSNSEEFDYPVGTIQTLNASGTPREPATDEPPLTKAAAFDADDRMEVYFDFNGTLQGAQQSRLPFAPKEGYEYRFAFFFKQADTDAGKNGCPGRAILDLKVIPEYLRWVGNADPDSYRSDWTNANNWRRSTAGELSDPDKADYPENDPYKRNYYAPMDFTKITIPIPMPQGRESGQIALLPPAYKQNEGGTHPILKLPETSAIDGYSNVEFDLAVKESDSPAGGVAYDCRTYYINTVAEVHFEPGAKMLNAERLTYRRAWVDYELAKGRWYTLASPFQAGNMFAGDWYTDAGTAREGNAYFPEQGIPTYQAGENSRVNPTVYQRGWDKASLLFLAPSAGSGRDTPPSTNVAIAGNWSGLYNDVTVPYDPYDPADAVSGFSLKVRDYTSGLLEWSLFRFPKQDTEYHYYTYNPEGGSLTEDETHTATIDRTPEENGNRYRLKVSELNTTGAEALVQSLSPTSRAGSRTDEPTYYLVGNPFMAHLDAAKFFNQNQHLEPKYWLVTGGNQSAAVGDEKGWISTEGDDEASIAPLRSFFVVKKANTGDTDNNVTFTADMQALGYGNDSFLRAADPGTGSAPRASLRIIATNGQAESRAVVAYDREASDEFVPGEDAELFLDSNLADVPTVYTVAGRQAATINRTNQPEYLPLGIYSRGKETVRLRFEGLEAFPEASLYDARTGSDTPLTEGAEVSVAGDSHGRYYLRAGLPTANETVSLPTETIRIYSVRSGKVEVSSSNAPLREVTAYGIDGRPICASRTLGGTTCTLDLPSGIYLIHARTAQSERTEKIRVD